MIILVFFPDASMLSHSYVTGYTDYADSDSKSGCIQYVLSDTWYAQNALISTAGLSKVLYKKALWRFDSLGMVCDAAFPANLDIVSGHRYNENDNTTAYAGY